jgi:hypothetical protein
MARSTPYSTTPSAEHFRRIDAVLSEHDALWRPSPFREETPAWCHALPALEKALLRLDDEQTAGLSGDPGSLLQRLAPHLPALRELAPLAALPTLPSQRLPPLPAALVRDIPGRKLTQILALAQALGPVAGPVLEWCGGKGHLGRALSSQWRTAVLTLERDTALCRAGERFARRSAVQQMFRATDVLVDDAPEELACHHAVALHACGDLHRRLAEHAAASGNRALDIAPCCYHLATEPQYTPYTAGARLRAHREELRLAVTETGTASLRVLRQRDQEMAWKFAYSKLRQSLLGDGRYAHLGPGDNHLLRGDFAQFCRTLALRDGITLANDLPWQNYLNAGWARQRRAMRLSLLRTAFRRVLELWLVLDLAQFLAREGFRVNVGTFCSRQVTPRNILIQARR